MWGINLLSFHTYSCIRSKTKQVQFKNIEKMHKNTRMKLQPCNSVLKINSAVIIYTINHTHTYIIFNFLQI